MNQEVGRLMLESAGLEVDVVNTGLEALDAFAPDRHALIFMDCQMPELDGHEATQAIRQKEARTLAEDPSTASGSPCRAARNGHTPIIALTAHAMQGDRERCPAAGMDDYLKKPFNSDQLLNVLGRWVPGSDGGESCGVD